MPQFNLSDHTHRRRNPLTGDWVLVSPHRTQRPWQGQVERPVLSRLPEYDPNCYLCPGNPRAGGVTNPRYEHTFVFDNDFAALSPQEVSGGVDQGGLLQAVPVRGVCRVLCFSPRHDATMAGMQVDEIRRVVDTWAAQTEELAALPFVRYVQVFENRGALMGASNPHPHGQIWATEQIPNEPAKEMDSQQAYLAAHGRPMLPDYLDMELRAGERLVFASEHFAVVVPFWAVWPFETLLLPRRGVAALSVLGDAERQDLAAGLKRLTALYDSLFETAFPYSMGWHQAPVDGGPHPGWTLHAHFYPPLLRSATVRKFMVGFEMLAEPQRDIPAEVAAEMLRRAGASIAGR